MPQPKQPVDQEHVRKLLIERDRLAAAAASAEAHQRLDADDLAARQYAIETAIGDQAPRRFALLSPLWAQHDADLSHSAASPQPDTCAECANTASARRHALSH